MKPNLIFDIGMHNGGDTQFYLSKGFRVVAVEADPDLAEKAKERFRDYLNRGRLIIVDRAISTIGGNVVLWRALSDSAWNTIDSAYAERNRRFGSAIEPVEVKSVTPDELFSEFGVPYYLKVDIEGGEVKILESLLHQLTRPRFISIESNKTSFQQLRHEFAILNELGYDRFKVVRQNHVRRQVPPFPALEGTYVEHEFKWGDSGLFGEEAPGRWLNQTQAISVYKSIFLRYMLVGDDPLLPRWVVSVLRLLNYRAGWYDTHARLRSSN